MEVSILTPSQVVIRAEASMVLLPGDDGEIGILPGHIPLIANMGPGVIKLYDGDKKEYETFVHGGFIKFHGERLSILSDAVSEISALNADKAAKDIERLEEQILTSGDQEYLNSIFREINILRKIIEICQEYKK